MVRVGTYVWSQLQTDVSGIEPGNKISVDFRLPENLYSVINTYTLQFNEVYLE